MPDLRDVTPLRRLSLTAACFFTFGLAASAQAAPSNIDKAMYFLAAPQDAEYCAVQQKDGVLVPVSSLTGKPISNPAMTCPDLFAWKLFADVINDRFWSNWADEAQNWPAAPYPLCQAGSKTTDCCDPNSNDGKAGHCPVFPGLHYAPKLKALFKAGSAQAGQLQGAPELARHTRLPFHSELNPLRPFNAAELNQASMKLLKSSASAGPQDCASYSVDGSSKDLVPAILAKIAPKDAQSIGRILRQTNAELTIRNLPFHDYLYRNNLYNADGALAVFFASSANLKQDAPYHRPNRSASRNDKGELVKIDLPSDAIMIKSNWVHQRVLQQLGIDSSPEQYPVKQLATQIDLTALGLVPASGGNDAQCNLTGPHHLAAFHISSKDIPNWVWATFEHRLIPGRCDVTGCNDSFGYDSADPRPAGTAANYVSPKQQSDQLNQPSVVFAPDQLYPKEQIRPELQKMLAGVKVGTDSASQDAGKPAEPSPTDAAWLNFRLKGAQTEFVNAVGQPTLLGNSITEAGFMDGSSCISCHARAGVAALGLTAGQAPDPKTVTGHFLALSVFERDLTDFGYFRSHHGIPNPAWYFNDNNSNPKLQVLQADFVWGFLNAQPLVKAK